MKLSLGLRVSEMVAYFTSLLPTIQDVIGTIPTLASGVWKFIDQIGSFDLSIKNIQVLTIPADSSYIETLPTSQSYTYYVDIIPIENTIEDLIGAGSVTNGNILIMIFSGKIRSHIWTFSGLKLIDSIATIQNGVLSRVLCKYDNSTKELKTFINGVFDSSVATFPVDFIPSASNIKIGGRLGTSSPNIRISNYQFYNRALSDAECVSISAINPLSDVIQNFYFEDSQGVAIIDSSANGYHGTLIGANQAVAWGTRVSGILPALTYYGYEIYENNSFPLNQAYYIYVIFANGVAQHPTISGYTFLAEIPPYAIGDNGNTYDGLQITGLETDATFNDIIALENSSTIEITKTANYISNLKVKA